MSQEGRQFEQLVGRLAAIAIPSEQPPNGKAGAANAELGISGIIPSAGLFRVDIGRAQDSDDLRPFDRHNQRLFRKARR